MMSNKYSKEFIQQVKEAVKLVMIILHFLSLKPSGNSFKGDCPFCLSKNSFHLVPKKKLYKCFKCDEGKGTDSIRFIMKFKKIEFIEAIEIGAGLSGIILEKHTNSSKKADVKLSFRDQQLIDSGIKNSFQIFENNEGVPTNRYQIGSIDYNGNRVKGDDMLLIYMDLDGEFITYKHPTKKIDIPLIRCRHKYPEKHISKKDGKPKKYNQPYGSGSHLWISELLRKAFQKRKKIKRLFITEGEKKAEKMCIHGMMAIGIMGISSLTDSSKMYETFLRILTNCEVEEIVFLLDADWNEISGKANKSVESRPNNFYSAVLKVKIYFEQFKNNDISLRIYFAYIKNKLTKGIDDLLVCELKDKEEELKSDFELTISSSNGLGKHIDCHDITSIKEEELRQFWFLDDEQSFIDAHFETLKSIGTFSINGNYWKINDAGILEGITAEISFDEEILNSPCLPDEIFQKLPPFLKDLTELFSHNRERDIFLLTIFGMLSGSIYSVTGIYDRASVFANLYFFALGPAGSGKGVMRFVKLLLNEFSSHIAEKNKERLNDYKIEKSKYEKALKQINSAGSTLPNEPIPPKLPRLFMPANSSATMLVRLLNDSDGKGIMFETEADTLGKTLKFEWGDISDILRKNFHTEPISLGRIGSETGLVDLDNSRFALVLSGTPNQIFNLIPSAEDGLYSRFLFYLFNEEPFWRDVSPKGDKKKLEVKLKTASKELLTKILFLEKHPSILHLENHQWDKLNSFFTYLLNETYLFFGSESLGTVKRLGLICFRIIMLLTSLRKAADKNSIKDIYCNEDDFDIAMGIVETCYQHSMILLRRLPNAKVAAFKKLPENLKAFYKSLPDKFKRKDAEVISKRFGIKRITFDRCLKRWLGSYLKKLEHGLYEKCDPQPSSLPKL